LHDRVRPVSSVLGLVTIGWLLALRVARPMHRVG
jgi:hypothetical protein